MWFVEVEGLRLLFDPLLDDTFFGGVFTCYPRREIHAAALAPDFIIVSHRHPDHFDVPSLHRLAQLDPETVVLTADPFIAETARAVGFRQVAVVKTLEKVRLAGGVELLTTPSHCDELEWGVMVASAAGVAWNQVDSVHRDAGDVTATLEAARVSLMDEQARWPVALALARWLPMREIEAVIGRATGFPLAGYGDLLQQVAAIGARTVLPAAGGQRHLGSAGWMNRFVYPLGQDRFVRDYNGLVPGGGAVTATIGARWEVAAGSAQQTDATSPFVTLWEDEVAPDFRPVSGLPELSDPGHAEVPEPHRVQRCEAWIRGPLADALAAADLRCGERPHIFALRVVHETAEQSFTLTRSGASVTVETTASPALDFDVYNEVAGSMLFDVIDGRRHWGEPLLAGMLRAVDRSYTVSHRGVERTGVGMIFLYHALPYRESQRRMVARQLALL